MHAAPAISFPVSRSGPEGWAALVLIVAGLSVLLAWAVFFVAPRAWQVMAAACWCVAGVGLLWRWWHAPCGVLAWDGRQWSWQPCDGTDPQAGILAVRFDFQQVLLVQFTRVSSKSSWHWLVRSAAPQRWHALRCAVFASQGMEPSLTLDALSGPWSPRA